MADKSEVVSVDDILEDEGKLIEMVRGKVRLEIPRILNLAEQSVGEK